jgi:uncharacterized protein with PQ loop repeat
MNNCVTSPNKFIIDVIGYAAAIVTNISVYPQAYDVYIIVNTFEYEKLNSLSQTTFSLQLLGCIFWLIFGILTAIYPIFIGAIMRIIPATYITINLYRYKTQPAIESNPDNQEID